MLWCERGTEAPRPLTVIALAVSRETQAAAGSAFWPFGAGASLFALRR